MESLSSTEKPSLGFKDTGNSVCDGNGLANKGQHRGCVVVQQCIPADLVPRAEFFVRRRMNEKLGHKSKDMI